MNVVEFTKTGKPVTHGRVSSYTSHACRCDDCRAAQAAAMRKARARNPGYRERQRGQKAAYNRATARLRANHLEEFHRMLAEERGDKPVELWRVLDEGVPSLAQMIRECEVGDPPAYRAVS